MFLVARCLRNPTHPTIEPRHLVPNSRRGFPFDSVERHSLPTGGGTRSPLASAAYLFKLNRSHPSHLWKRQRLSSQRVVASRRRSGSVATAIRRLSLSCSKSNGPRRFLPAGSIVLWDSIRIPRCLMPSPLSPEFPLMFSRAHPRATSGRNRGNCDAWRQHRSGNKSPKCRRLGLSLPQGGAEGTLVTARAQSPCCGRSDPAAAI